MPSNIILDPFRRFRLRSTPVPTLPSSSGKDSDESSPERDRLHVIHVLAPKNGRKSGEHRPSIPENEKLPCGTPEKLTESTHIAFALDRTPHTSHPEQSPKKPSKSGVVSDSVEALQPSTKLTLIRRVTSKLHISIPSKPSTRGLPSRPSTRTLPAQMGPPVQRPRSPRPTVAVSPTLSSGFVSREHREAALRERGLRPPRKDLSEQEREADERLGSVPSPSSVNFDGPSEAERLKARWLAVNRTSESSDSDCGLPAPSQLQGISTGPRSVLASRSASTLPDGDVLRRSGEGKTDLPPVGRPSICSSVPPLSTSSYLEVLHEDPSEQAPITPPPPISPLNLPIIVSSPLEFPPSPIFMESPVSFTFSSHYPASTLDSQSQSDHSRVPEKGNSRSCASRSRTSDSGDRPRKVVGSSFSRMGTRSLSNLRRSVAGSLKLQSSSTLSSADLPPSSTAQAPRTAISPTIHNIGSIIRETKDIADAESRRLSELAFLD